MNIIVEGSTTSRPAEAVMVWLGDFRYIVMVWRKSLSLVRH